MVCRLLCGSSVAMETRLNGEEGEFCGKIQSGSGE